MERDAGLTGDGEERRSPLSALRPFAGMPDALPGVADFMLEKHRGGEIRRKREPLDRGLFS